MREAKRKMRVTNRHRNFTGIDHGLNYEACDLKENYMSTVMYADLRK